MHICTLTHTHTHTYINLMTPVLSLQGEITIDGSFDGGISVRTRDNPKGHHYGSLGGYMAAFGPQMEAFLDAVVNSEKQEVEDSPWQALQEVLVAQAVYKSAQTGQWESTALDNLCKSRSGKM